MDYGDGQLYQAAESGIVFQGDGLDGNMAEGVDKAEEDLPFQTFGQEGDEEVVLPEGWGEDPNGVDQYVEGMKPAYEYKVPEYQIGTPILVMRSDESWSPCVIAMVYVSALGPIYDVQLEDGQMKCGVAEDSLSFP
jgi:hypothetical protein